MFKEAPGTDRSLVVGFEGEGDTLPPPQKGVTPKSKMDKNTACFWQIILKVERCQPFGHCCGSQSRAPGFRQLAQRRWRTGKREFQTGRIYWIETVGDSSSMGGQQIESLL
jgi:hypothetical protein